MQSKCHSAAGVPDVVPGRVADETLLDAARDCVLSAGVRKTTLAGVARTAGVSRMTVYRRFPDAGSLLATLMTREFTNLLARVSADATGSTARVRLVDTALQAIRALAEDPVMRSILDNDAILLLPYLVERIGSTQRVAEQFLRESLRTGHADGSVRRGDVAVQARTFFLTVAVFVLTLRPATTDIEPSELLADLRAQLDGALRPPHERPRESP